MMKVSEVGEREGDGILKLGLKFRTAAVLLSDMSAH